MGIEVVFVLVLAVGIAYLFWLMLRNASDKIGRQYEKMAFRFRVHMTEPPAQLCGFIRAEPFLHGIYRDREISLSVPGKGLQNTRQIETILKIMVNDKSFKWQMTATGLFGGMRQRDSGIKQRWSSGDSVFDTAVDVRTNNDERLRRILDSARLDEIRDILKGSKASISLRDGVLYFSEFGLIADDIKRERFEQVTEFLCLLAEVIEGR
jgi:hypothetical protein